MKSVFFLRNDTIWNAIQVPPYEMTCSCAWARLSRYTHVSHGLMKDSVWMYLDEWNLHKYTILTTCHDEKGHCMPERIDIFSEYVTVDSMSVLTAASFSPVYVFPVKSHRDLIDSGILYTLRSHCNLIYRYLNCPLIESPLATISK